MQNKKNLSLARKIRRRKDLIRKIDGFVGRLLLEKGEIIKKEVCSSNTHIIRKLDLGKFSFFLDDGQTMFGGTGVEIYYRQNNENVLVFSIHYQNILECEVRAFDTKSNWLSALALLVKNKSKIWKQKIEKEERLKRQKMASVVSDAERMRLEEEAIRLKL